MKRIALLLAAAAVASSCAQTSPPAPPPPADTTSLLYGPNFLQTAGSANLWEIESSQLALQISANTAVRGFAQMIIADHTQLGGQVAAAAQAAGLPPPPQVLLPADQAKLDQLRNAGPNLFDTNYRDMQVAAHQQAIALFQNYATGGDNPVLRNAAAQALPTLQKHLAAAQALMVVPTPGPPPPPPPAPPPPPPPVRRGERG